MKLKLVEETMLPFVAAGTVEKETGTAVVAAAQFAVQIVAIRVWTAKDLHEALAKEETKETVGQIEEIALPQLLLPSCIHQMLRFLFGCHIRTLE